MQHQLLWVVDMRLRTVRAHDSCSLFALHVWRVPGWHMLYDALWGCNTSMVLAAMAMLLGLPRLAGGAVRTSCQGIGGGVV